MSNDKLLEALQQARQMDEELQPQYDQAEADRFLDVIQQIESSGGRNFAHPTIKSGIHRGDNAIGNFGLMPNTVAEIRNRMRTSGDLSDDIRDVANLPAKEMKAALESDPTKERMLADYLAKHVLNKFDDEEKAAYGWFQGHNMSPERMEREPYKEHDYVKKYRRFKKLLGE